MIKPNLPSPRDALDALSMAPQLARRKPRYVIYLTLAALLGTAGFWYYRGLNSHNRGAVQITKPADRVVLPPNAPQLTFLKLEPAASVPLPAAGPFNARLSVAEDFTARIFPPVNGRITQLQANLGDTVQKGALLAVIDAPEFGSAQADVHKADANALLKQRGMTRAKTLYEGGAISRRELEASEADFAAARAEAERTHQRLHNLLAQGEKIDGERLPLKSPLNGIVVDRQANPGTEVRSDANQPLFVIADLSRLWLTLDLPETETGVHVGDSVYFTVDAWPGQTFSAKISRVSPVLDPATRRIPVRAVIDNSNSRLRPEMYARANVMLPDAQKVLRIPASALLTQGLTSALFVEASPGEFVRRNIKTLRQDKEFVYLAAGEDSPIKAGDRIVVKGAMLLASNLAGAD